VQYLLVGILISFLAKRIAEAKLIKNDGVNEPLGGHKIEPLYAFDIHCNSFFPVILFSYLIPVSRPKRRVLDYMRLPISSACLRHYISSILLLFDLQGLCDFTFHKEARVLLVADTVCDCSYSA